MPLLASARLGPYEILSRIGAGGMGEVYKARDTRLDRIVAIKVLPAAFAADPERKLRFEREARAISGLNHPHICALYDIGQHEGIDFLVMEHLEGESLEERLRKGPLPMDQVVQYATEIAEALDVAHRHGVIHRDLKPGNVVLTKIGAKLLDFGLAKIIEAPAATAGTAMPTMTQPLTAHGTIMGTYQYMAPEQLEGQEADVRGDIFAFGAVIYEMAVGKRAFEGKSQASLISAIMTSQPPPISTAQPMAPPALDQIVRTCLAKNPDERWQTVHDILLQLKWIAQGGSIVGVPKPVLARANNRARWSWIAAGLCLAAAAGVSAIHFREKRADAVPIRFYIESPENVTLGPWDKPVISPDGRKVVFSNYSVSGDSNKLWIRQLDSLETRSLTGTEGAFLPFWSPDSRSIGYFTVGKLNRVDVGGGHPAAVCDAPGRKGGGAWNRDGVIVFYSDQRLRKVSANGGEPTDLSSNPEGFLWPAFLPDGRHFLFFRPAGDSGKRGVYIGTLDSTETKLLFKGDTQAVYAPPGYVLFKRDTTLSAQPFDAGKLRFTGDAFPIVENVGIMDVPGGALSSVSDNGTLAYRGGVSANLELAWYSREGKREGTAGVPGSYRQLAVSPDAKRAVVERLDPQTRTYDLWLLELGTNILSRLTFDAGDDTDAVWSPDSREIIFSSNRNGKLDLFRKRIGGTDEELLYADKERKVCEWWPKDNSIIYTTQGSKTIYRLPLAGERKPQALFKTDFTKEEPHVSPDGRWVAYNSLESGQFEVYIASYPSFTEKRQVSNHGGGQA
ncbi:MAG: protein kinase, partial [Acidobacteriota bacterium]|nr:protein kinase [Acidobacteriota bacterium]